MPRGFIEAENLLRLQVFPQPLQVTPIIIQRMRRQLPFSTQISKNLTVPDPAAQPSNSVLGPA